jgi:hypothetical protein
MAVSSNLRYNAVNGAEDVLYALHPLAGRGGSIALRLANNFFGAAQWVSITQHYPLERPWVGAPRTVPLPE